jgi:hypothetical protein
MRTVPYTVHQNVSAVVLYCWGSEGGGGRGHTPSVDIACGSSCARQSFWHAPVLA